MLKERLTAAHEGLEIARQEVLAEMHRVARVFYAQREAVIEAGAGEGVFIPLTLSILNQDGALKACWVRLHYRNKKRTGITSLPSSKGDYNLLSLKAGAPEALHHDIEKTELALRYLRRRLVNLSSAKRLTRGALDAAMPDFPLPNEQEGRAPTHPF